MFCKNNDLGYFKWNHNLLINSICHNLAVNKNKFLLLKNYGKLDLLPFNEKWKHNILPDSLHSILNEVKPNWPPSNMIGRTFDLFRKWNGPPNNDFSGKYFIGNVDHTNKFGHQKIVEIIRKEMSI